MSWPPPAATSAAFLAARSVDRMWSTCISTLFFVPHSLDHWSNQVSYAGTKCEDIRILRVPTLAKPPGAACAAPAGAPPAAGALVAETAAAGGLALELHAANSEPMTANPPVAP